MNYKAWARPKPGVMNRLESKYAAHLETLKHSGEILMYIYEPFNLRLATKTYYRPDFMVLKKDLSITVAEVKGFWLDDSRAKVKIAADKFPFRFVGVTFDRKRGWVEEEF